MNEASNASSGLIAALVDEFVRAGVTDAVVSPGSRSTPLALEVAERLRTHVVLDERSAGFVALGYGKETGVPAVLVCTSGTAAANYYPAVKEADLSAVPMLVCTADRPPELRDTGAPQAMDQLHLYGTAVRWFCDPGVPGHHPGAGTFWRSLGARAVAEATGARPGPVHLNLPFREPFLADDLIEVAGRSDGAPWTQVVRADPVASEGTALRTLLRAVGKVERGLLLVGQASGVAFDAVARFEAATGWPVLADPLSGLRSLDTITTYDALLRVDEWAAAHRPDAVVRLGAPLTSKALATWLTADVVQVAIEREPTHADPHRTLAVAIAADPSRLLRAAAEAIHRGAHEWMAEWMVAEGRARVAMDAALDAAGPLTEPRIARDVVAALPAGTRLLAGSSMPVRDVESFAAGRRDVVIRSNRGANGIDGMVSTAAGMAIGSGTPTVALIGDIGFLHDTGGLRAAVAAGVDLTVVVVDNDGGGIFSFLPQAGHPRFEQLFGTPHGADIPALAAAHGVAVTAPTDPGDVGPAVADAVSGGGVRVVHLVTDRNANVAAHRAVWDAVGAALEE